MGHASVPIVLNLRTIEGAQGVKASMCCCYASTEAFLAGACAYGATPGTFRGLPVIAGDKRGDLVLLPFARSPRIQRNRHYPLALVFLGEMERGLIAGAETSV